MEKNERLEAAIKCAERYTDEKEKRIARSAFMSGCEFEAQGEIVKGIVLEQPVCEGLEEEIERYLHSLGVGYGGWVDGMEDDDLRGIARHFAQWGAEHARE